MARLQILQLPEGGGDDRPPFVLVIDQYQAQRYILGPDQPEPVGELDGLAEKIGARAVLGFQETIDIPANDLTAYSSNGGSDEVDPHEAHRLALCDALLLSLGSTWEQIVKQAAERQRTVADLYRRLDGQPEEGGSA